MRAPRCNWFPCRRVAQPGSALPWGGSGRRFKSSRADQFLRISVVALLLSACGAAPKPDAATAECRSLFSQLDEQTIVAEVRDAASYAIPGFPYLRSNRFLASFGGELGDDGKFLLWVEQLRLLDLSARRIETRNLGPAAVELQRINACGKTLAQHELADARWRQQLIARAQVPDDYSLLTRALGAYPVTAPFLRLGINSFHKAVRADYAQPLDDEVDGRPLFLWSPDPPPTPAAEVAALVTQAPHDVLGIPQLSEAQWWQLARAHAPSWWIETSGEFDLIGAPAAGAGFHPDAHVAYFQPGYTRFSGEVLPQLTYVIWFAERPPVKALDPYSGALDGVVWRVTLDRDGLPLIYDTIHPCGCYHYYFPAKFLRHQPAASFWQEPMLVPQDSAPPEKLAIRIQTETHYVRRVLPAAEAHSKKRRIYRLRPYSDLLSLETDSGYLSLFGTDGLIAGSERGERWWLWMSGIRSPGAMRQNGRHATAFIGREHFDDPWLLDRSFSRTP